MQWDASSAAAHARPAPKNRVSDGAESFDRETTHLGPGPTSWPRRYLRRPKGVVGASATGVLFKLLLSCSFRQVRARNLVKIFDSCIYVVCLCIVPVCFARLKEAVALVNQIDTKKFTMLLTRIISRLPEKVRTRTIWRTFFVALVPCLSLCVGVNCRLCV